MVQLKISEWYEINAFGFFYINLNLVVSVSIKRVIFIYELFILLEMYTVEIYSEGMLNT